MTSSVIKPRPNRKPHPAPPQPPPTSSRPCRDGLAPPAVAHTTNCSIGHRLRRFTLSLEGHPAGVFEFPSPPARAERTHSIPLLTLTQHHQLLPSTPRVYPSPNGRSVKPHFGDEKFGIAITKRDPTLLISPVGPTTRKSQHSQSAPGGESRERKCAFDPSVLSRSCVPSSFPSPPTAPPRSQKKSPRSTPMSPSGPSHARCGPTT